MTAYIVRRLLLMIPMLIGISLISFAIIQFAPGKPEGLLLDPQYVTSEQGAAVRQQLGLDDPLPIQYLKTVKSLLAGDLRSYRTPQTVQQLVAESLPATLAVGGLALLLGTAAGIALGVLQALRPYSRVDALGTLVSLLGFSIPNFWLALMLILVFGVMLRWLPVSSIRPLDATGWDPRQMAPYLILPTFVLGSNFMATVARYTRSSMLEALAQEYVRTAHAKGLPGALVTIRHALRNSLLPVITLIAFFLPNLLGGAAIVESIFSLPGLGRLAVDSAFFRDYPVILSLNMMFAAAVLLGNLLADLGYAVADPRIRYA